MKKEGQKCKKFCLSTHHVTKRCNHCLYVVFTKTADDLDHESINILQNTNHEVCAYILSFIREEQYGSNLPILQKNKQRVVVVLEVSHIFLLFPF